MALARDCHWCSLNSPTELLGSELFLGCREQWPVDAKWGRDVLEVLGT
jgi:hypothetical protein